MFVLRGDNVARSEALLDGDAVASIDVVSMKDIPALGFFGRAWSNIKLLTYQFLMEE